MKLLLLSARQVDAPAHVLSLDASGGESVFDRVSKNAYSV
jgi:hypothetical protein